MGCFAFEAESLADGPYSCSTRRTAVASFFGAWHWLALWLAVAACSDSAPEPRLTSVSPSVISASVDNALEVRGARFHPLPEVALGSSSKARLNATFRVRVGSVFETAAVERVDAQTLRFTLPAGLPAGAYDLTVLPPGRASLRLAAALQIQSDVASDSGTPDAGMDADAAIRSTGQTLHFEDAPGGAGKPLEGVSARPVGDVLDVYAVLRDASGAFVADVSVRWTVTGDSAGMPDPELSSHLSVPLNKLGELSIAADYRDLSTQLGPITVVAGHARELTIVPSTASLRTSDPKLVFQVTGVDALGNATTDVGPLTWKIELGSFGDFDAQSATLTPRQTGSGRISVTSGYGSKAVSGLISVSVGVASELSIEPATLSVSADDAPVQLSVTGRDAFGHTTTELGELTWSIASGSIGAIGADGLFDPTHVGVGTIAVMSSLGVGAQSGSVEVRPGRASSFSFVPTTWSGTVGDAPVAFTTSALDADGNETSDVGTLSYAVGSGPIGEIEPLTGVLTPRAAGDGTLKVTSSYGASGVSGNVHIADYALPVSLSAMRVTDLFWPTESNARVEVDVKNDSAQEVLLTGMALSFVFGGSDVSGDYTVTPDRANADRVAAGSTRTLVFWVEISANASRLGTLTINASADVFMLSGYSVARAASTTTSHRSLTLGVKVSLSAPVVPNNRRCSGGTVTFGATYTGSLLTPDYSWKFSGGSITSSSNNTPNVTYGAAGAFPYYVTGTETLYGYPDTAVGQPIYVGALGGTAAATYPAGPIVLSTPSAGQSVSLLTFPRSDLLQVSGSTPITQCDGTLVAAVGHNTLTVFSDRRLFDPALDTDLARAGLQLAFTSAGILGSIPLRAPSSQTEGSTTVYLEYVDDVTGALTAAGDTTFRLSQDKVAPRVDASYPLSDCSSACISKGEPLLFVFSEPMTTSTLSNLKVELLASASCAAGVQSDITSGTTRRYDAASRSLYVTPVTQSAPSYALRISLPTSLTDAASTPNALTAFSRCVIVQGTGAGNIAPKPYVLSGGASTFTPDGDGQAEDVSWSVRAYADTVALRLSVSRGRSELRALLVPVSGPGDYMFTWDGSDNAGRVADTGAYRYDVTAISRAGVASAAVSGYVELRSAVNMVSVRRRY